MTTAPAEKPKVPSWRLLATLGFAGAMAGLLVVATYAWTLPHIEEHRATALRIAIEEVLHDPQRADTLYLHDGALVESLPAGVSGAKLERVYRGRAADGRVLGYAIVGRKAGFADDIVVIFGYEPQRRTMLGVKVLYTRETPGLGDKITAEPFTGQFNGKVAPIEGLKGAVPEGDENGVTMITGATISSRTVIRAMNEAVERWEPLIARQQATAGGQQP